MIALEEHLLPKDVAAAIGVDPASLLGKSDALDDLGEGRLQSMDAAGIDVQVLSAVAHAVQELDPDQALAVSRDLNDRMAAAVAAHPGRFRAFATLPMCDPKASAAELSRAVEELGFVGTMIHGQTRGMFLDDPSAEPDYPAAGIANWKHQPIAEAVVEARTALACALQNQAYLKQAASFLFRCAKAFEQGFPGIGGIAQAKRSTGFRIDTAPLQIGLGTWIIRQILLEEAR